LSRKTLPQTILLIYPFSVLSEPVVKQRPKNALSLLKNRKICRALGAPSPDPLASGGWGFAPRPPVVFGGWGSSQKKTD